MGDAFASFLLEQGLKWVTKKGKQLLEFKDKFQNQTTQLQYMHTLLKDVEKKNAELETLNQVRRDLIELIHDVEDVIADCELPKRISPNRQCIIERFSKLDKKIERLKHNMTTYLQAASNLTSNEKEDENQSSNYPILIKEANIVGLEDDFNKLREWILEASGPPMVIGIVGSGGIGKTTLTQKTYNNVKNSFKHTAQVIVSRRTKFDRLLREILKELKVKDKLLHGKEIKDLLTMLQDKLDGRYLLFLDDVWGLDEKQWWDSLESALPDKDGSCIIVTTRNEKVAKNMGAIDRYIHHLKILSDDNSWSLFCKVGKCLKPDLEPIGKQIVARCEGLPLAIKAVGRVMLQKEHNVNEWTRVLEHLKEELAGDKKEDIIISSLKSSYENLPDYLKRCLLSLALYPEDITFSDRSLIYHWIGEGLICGKNGKTAIEIGKEYLVELVNRCLIIVKGKDLFENSIRTWRVHAMVRHMVINIAREENFVNLLHKDEPLSDPKQCRRVAIYKDTTLTSMRKYTKLRTLLEWDIESTEVISNLNTKLDKFRWLRVLKVKLSSTKVDEHVKNWLSGNKKLWHLVCLSIYNSALEILPDSIGDLYNLQVLKVQNCPNLKRLPSSIKSLKKLIVLDVDGCDSLKYWPEGIANLSNLERLYRLNLTSNDGFRISQLESLTKLRELEVVINYEKQLEEGELKALSMLQHLRYLRIEVGDNCRRAELSSKIDRLQLSPLKSLEELRLANILDGERTPVWLNPTSFPNLRFLYIYKGSIKRVVHKFKKGKNRDWRVERLVLDKLKELEEEWSSITKAMPSLTLLKVRNCPKLKSFPIDVTSSRFITWRSEQSL